jgi:hypothetical protein
MTSTATAAGVSRVLPEQQLEQQVRDRRPHREAPRYADHQAYVQRAAGSGSLRVQDACYLVLLGGVQLMWIAALVYAVVRLLA